MGPPKFKGQSLVVTLLHIRLPIVWLWPLNTFAAPHFFLSLLTVYTGTATYNGVSVSSSSRELPPGHAIFSSVESNHSTLKRHSAQARNSWWAEWGDHGSESRFPNKVSHIFHSSESSKNGLVGEKMDYMGHWKSLSGQVIQRWGFQKKKHLKTMLPCCATSEFNWDLLFPGTKEAIQSFIELWGSSVLSALSNYKHYRQLQWQRTKCVALERTVLRLVYGNQTYSIRKKKKWW